MTKLEIQTLINTYLNSNTFYIVDMLNARVKIDSYDSMMELLKTARNTYKDKIIEFEKECSKYIEKIDQFVEHCQSIEENKIEQEIRNDFKHFIFGDRYCSEKRIEIIFISSLDNTAEKSEYALTTIYKELGYDKLKYYIELLKNSGNLTSYLNDSSKQEVAMHYILFKTDHHSKNSFVRNTSTRNLYNMMKENIDDSIKEITNEKQDFVDFMNAEKESFKEWTSSTEEEKNKLVEEYDNFLKDCNTRIENLENLYNKKLKVEEPAEFMNKKSKEYLWASIRWALATIILTVGLIWILGIIVSPKIDVGEKIIEVSLFSKQIPIYESIILLAIVCLIIYILRVFVKMTISSKHLSEEYKQKYILTYFYLSLISEGKIDDSLSNAILSKLFTKADTGLIKNDASVDPESLYKTLTSVNK